MPANEHYNTVSMVFFYRQQSHKNPLQLFELAKSLSALQPRGRCVLLGLFSHRATRCIQFIPAAAANSLAKLVPTFFSYLTPGRGGFLVSVECVKADLAKRVICFRQADACSAVDRTTKGFPAG